MNVGNIHISIASPGGLNVKILFKENVQTGPVAVRYPIRAFGHIASADGTAREVTFDQNFYGISPFIFSHSLA